MSIHVDDLRNTCGLLGELAAAEIEDLEKAYALLFAENARLASRLAALQPQPAGVKACPSCGMREPRHLAGCAAIAGVNALDGGQHD